MVLGSIVVRKSQVPCAFSCVTRTLSPLETTLPAGHAILIPSSSLFIKRLLINNFWKVPPDNDTTGKNLSPNSFFLEAAEKV
jgi:hypothetical protein